MYTGQNNKDPQICDKIMTHKVWSGILEFKKNNLQKEFILYIHEKQKI